MEYLKIPIKHITQQEKQTIYRNNTTKNIKNPLNMDNIRLGSKVGIDKGITKGISVKRASPREGNNYGLNHNSFIPMLQEGERFIKFLIKRFNLPIKEDWVFTINKASPSAIGFFMPKEHRNHYTNTTQDLNNINLNTLHLKKSSPYECLAHEVAHFLNKIEGVKGCSSNQYHNKHFKKKAELLLLGVEKMGRFGYAHTTETPEFKKMLEEFKPNKEVFNISQSNEGKKKVGSRLKKWVCGCGCIVRCAVELNAVCLDCNTNFKKVDDD